MWTTGAYACCSVVYALVLIRIHYVSCSIRAGNLWFLFILHRSLGLDLVSLLTHARSKKFDVGDAARARHLVIVTELLSDSLDLCSHEGFLSLRRANQQRAPSTRSW